MKYEKLVHEHRLWVTQEPDPDVKTLTRMLHQLPPAEVLEQEARPMLQAPSACFK